MTVVGVGDCSIAYGVLPQYVRRMTQAATRLNPEVSSAEDAAKRLGFQPPADLDSATMLVEAAHTSYVLNKWDDALAKLVAAEAQLRGAVPGQYRERTWLTMNAWRALLHHVKKEGAKADADLEHRFALSKEDDLQRGLFVPSFLERYDRVRAGMTQRSQAWGAIEIRTPGVQARGFVDGCDVGQTPVAVKVPDGEYDVSVSLDRRPSAVHGVKVKGGRPVTITVDAPWETSIDPGGPCVNAPADRDALLRTAQRLVQAGSFGRVLVVRLEAPSGPTGFLAATLVVAGDSKDAGVKIVREGRLRVPPEGPTDADLDALAQFALTGRKLSSAVAEAGLSGEAGPGTPEHPLSPTPVAPTPTADRPLASSLEVAAPFAASAPQSASATSRTVLVRPEPTSTPAERAPGTATGVTKESPSPPSVMTAPRWVAVGTGAGAVAGIAIGFGFLFAKNSAVSDYQAIYDPSCGCYPPDKAGFASNRLNAAQTDNTAMVGSLVGAGALAVIAVGALVFDLAGSHRPVNVAIIPTANGLGIAGRWP